MIALDAALEYAARGWPVFPCKPGEKTPATHHGFKDATTETELIRWWWRRLPAANVAIATGGPAVDVVDVDVKPAGSGFAAFNRAKRAGLLAGVLALVRTPSGGLHAYFPGTEQGCGALPAHFLDFKATGGYVLAPPSQVNGRPYELLDARQQGRPVDWQAIRRFLDPPAPRPAGISAWPSGDAVGRLAGWLEGQQNGNRNRALFWAACRALDDGATESDLDRLADTALRLGLPELEVRRTLSSAVRTARRAS